ncbi:TraB/GumN family protein [Parvularcula flava]|uniref:TraB/GumN family protein n=1 Tax=Aquisalinus luteolus TaxID=1566827 RepID=A0A8J3A1P9_9PROT|nr:TraB/GumN family protein [Aquisalinus luteolus]NHK26826.1 TraB/GumN family protein [Aquisalinus luteolus]GGH93529.1 hypothetical protein GCM10011355_05580 [Aquisalinus luteolus]
MRKFLIGLGASLLAIGHAAAEPAMWKASDEDSEIYLFGSIHLLDKGAPWQTEALDKALSLADYYYYELAMDAEAQALMQTLALQYGTAPEGKTLSSYLTEEQKTAFDAAVTSYGMSPATLEPYRPWLAYLTLSVVSVQAAGFDPASGVETIMMAQTDDEKERYFETAEQQIRFFADMPDDVQAKLLVTVVEQIEEGPEVMTNMANAWRSGDVQTLDEIVNDSMADVSDEVYQTLIVKRNKAWVEEIRTLMEGDEEAVIIVGAGHLIGDDGVPALLEAEGIKVERIQ